MKNILVIGGSYFAGRVFLEVIASGQDYAVSIFNRGNVLLNIEGIQHIIGNRELKVDVATIPNLHWDVVVDFCGYTAAHIKGLLTGLAGGVSHYIFISTTSVYDSDNPVPVNEDGRTVKEVQPELGDFADYGFNKIQAEQTLAELASKKSFRYTILRPAIIYGSYNYAPRESWFFDALLQGKSLVVPGRAEGRFSFVWVHDLARLIKEVLEQETDESATYNVAAPASLGYSEFIENLEKACGSKPIVKKMALKQISLRKITLPFPPDTDLQYDGSRIADALNFHYTPFHIGIKQTWQEYKAQRNAS